MNKRKKKIGWALLEGLCELALTLLCLGIGAFIVHLFGVDFDSQSIDCDLLTLLGIAVLFISFGIIYALVQWIKKSLRKKRKEAIPDFPIDEKKQQKDRL